MPGGRPPSSARARRRAATRSRPTARRTPSSRPRRCRARVRAASRIRSLSAGPRNVSAPGIAGVRHGAAGDQERVVAERPRPPACGPRAGRRRPPRARRATGPTPTSSASAPRSKWRTVPRPKGSATATGRYQKLGSGASELDAGPALAELAQRQRRLERGDAAAGDQDREARHPSHLDRATSRRTEGIGESASTRLGFLRIVLGRLGEGDGARAPSAAPEPRRLAFAVARVRLRAVGGGPGYRTRGRTFRRFVHRSGRELSAKCGERRVGCPQRSTGGGRAWGKRAPLLRRARPRSRPAARRGRRAARARAASRASK